MELVKEMMTNVITKTKAEIFGLYVRRNSIFKKMKVIIDKYEKEFRNIIKEEIQHQLAMQYLKQPHQLLEGPPESLSQVLKQILEQKKEQIEEEILQQSVIMKTVLEKVIKETMACLLSKLEEQEPKQLTELKIIIKAQEQKQSPEIFPTKQKIKRLWNGLLMDCRLLYYLDQLRQNSCQYYDRKKFVKDAALIKIRAHKICQQPVQATYSFVPIIIKMALSMEQQAQKPKRDKYYLKIACYMAMLSKDTTKPVSDFMYHACKNYV